MPRTHDDEHQPGLTRGSQRDRRDLFRSPPRLSHLRTLPLTVLKLDRSLVAGIVTDARDETLCRSLIDLGHQLDMTVIAEGVEEQGQLRALQRMGCDMLQGFLLSRPQPAVSLSEADAVGTVPSQAQPLDGVRLPSGTR